MNKRVAFFWTNMGEYGGVHSFLISCLQGLPEHGIDPFVVELRSNKYEPDNVVRTLARRIRTMMPKSWESYLGFRIRTSISLRNLSPDLLVFIESYRAKDILRLVPEELAAINLCLADCPDGQYYRNAKELAPRMSLTIGNSQTIVKELNQVLGPSFQDRIRHLMIGVEIPDQIPAKHPTDGRVHIMFIARLEQYHKRARDLVPFTRRLAYLGMLFKLTIVGGGSEYVYLQRELAPFIGDGRVIISGAWPLPEVLKLLAEQDFLVLFSAFEGLPLVLLHSLAFGVVPVVTDVRSGVSEILRDGQVGRVFPVGKPEKAAEIIAELANDVESVRELQRQARHLSHQFSSEQTLADFARLVEETLSGKKPIQTWQVRPRPLFEGSSFKTMLKEMLPMAIVARLAR